MEPRIERSDRGFSLVELMVVIAILALLATGATLGINRPGAARAQDWTRFGELHARMRERSVTGNEVLGLALNSAGFRTLRRESGRWVEQGKQDDWHGTVFVERPRGTGAIVAFLPSGQSTPLRLRFAGNGRAALCESDGWRALECTPR